MFGVVLMVRSTGDTRPSWFAFTRRLHAGSGLLFVSQEFLCGQVDVFCNLTEKNGGNVSGTVIRYGCLSPVGMTELTVRSSLTNLFKPKTSKNSDDFFRFQDRKRSHDYTMTAWVPTNSASSLGSPSSKSICRTSWRFACNSSSVSPWECAPGKPGTYPVYSFVSGQRSIMAVNVLMMPLYHRGKVVSTWDIMPEIFQFPER